MYHKTASYICQQWQAAAQNNMLKTAKITKT